MAISAKFIADFTSFQDAVRKADVSLNQFDQSSKKVGASLNRMVDSFSGAKVIREATLAEEAVLRIGGASKLTEDEQAKVNRTITEALAKYKALGVEAPASLRMMAEETKKIEAATIPASKSMQGFLDAFKGTLAGMVSATAIIGGVKSAFSALASFVTSSVKSYADAEAAQRKLTAALTAAGQATPQVIGQFNRLAKEFQNTTVYSDDLVTEMQALLVQVGGVMPHQMEGALQAATNLASGLGVDLRQATMLVGKAFEGETGTLKRYGIVIDEAKLKAEGMPAVLAAIQEKFGGQAQAEAEGYTGKLKQMENAWDDLKEAVGQMIVEDPLVTAAMRHIADAVKDAGDSAAGAGVHFTAFAAGLVSNSQQVKAFIEILGGMQAVLDNAAASAKKLGGALPRPAGFAGEAAPNAPGATPAEIKALQGPDPAVVKRAADAVKQYADSVKQLRESLTGVSLQGEVKKLQAAFDGLTPAQERSTVVTDNFSKAAKRLYDDGAKLTPELFRIMVATQQLTPPMQALSAEMLNSLGPALKSTYDLSAKLPTVLSGLSSSIGNTFAVKMPEQVQVAIDNSKKLKGSLEDISKALSELSQVSGDSFGELISGLATIVASANTAQKGIEAFQAGFKGFKGDPLSGILSMSSGILGIASAAIAAGKAIAGMFDRSKGRDLIEEFAGSQGGFKTLHEKLLTLGADGERLWIQFTQGVGRNNPEQAKAAIEAITKAFEEQAKAADQTSKEIEESFKRQFGTLNSQLDVFLKNAVGMGGQLPEEFEPFIQQLKTMGLLTGDTAAALESLGMGNAAGFQQMEDAAKRFGIELAALGPVYQQQKLTATSTDIIKTFEMLIANGADFNGVLAGMKDEINTVVKDSIKFGTEIPANMKPWIDKLIEAGDLVDENGEKITDVSKLKFGETIKVGLEDVVKKLQEMIDLMTKGVSGAVKGIGDDLDRNKRDWDDWRRRAKDAANDVASATGGVGGGSQPPGDQSGREPELAGGTRGKFLDFGSGTRVILHGRERVMTPGEGGGEITIKVPVSIDGRQVAEASARYIPEVMEGRF